MSSSYLQPEIPCLHHSRPASISAALVHGEERLNLSLRLVKMSLISQNASVSDSLKKKKEAKKKSKTILVEEGGENIEDESKVDVDETSNSRRRKRVRKENDEILEAQEEEEMKRLENFVFASLHNPVVFGKDEKEEANDEVYDGDALFFTDRSGNSMLPVYEEDIGSGEEKTKEQGKNQRKPVWMDDEEERTNVNIAKVNKLRKLRKEEDETVISGSAYVSRLRAQHIKMNPGTEWSRPDSQLQNYSDDEDSDKESEVVDPLDAGRLLRTTEDLISRSSVKLLPRVLEHSRLVDANVKYPSNAPINSVQFHKNSELLLVGGLDRTLRFFQIDGKKNDVIQSIFLEDCPIRKAAFLPDGSQVIVSGRRKFAYSFDLVKARVDKIGPLVGRDEKSLESFEVSPDSSIIAFLGNEGYILLVHTKTKELIGTLKMNASVRSLAFTNDGQRLLSAGGDGKIYCWDMRTRTCSYVGVDDGCLTGTALCVSPSDSLFAAGSDSGVVNIYNSEQFSGAKRKPLKAIENLTTRVDFVKFNHDGQILAISSRMKKNSMRLIHIPSLTVFENWPRQTQSLHYPTCMDFSPRGGFMTVGNAAGKVLLYKLHHYQQA